MSKLQPFAAPRAFDAAARYLSFKHVAQELGLTPTAISHQQLRCYLAGFLDAITTQGG